MEIVVETPKGSHQKFKYYPEKKSFEINKQLPGGMAFPFNFGFLPATKGEDGDSLDVIILSETSYQTGSIVVCKVIGCLPAKQTHQEQTIRNDRFVAVAAQSEQYAGVVEIAKLPEGQVQSIKDFFINYLASEDKKVVFLPDLDSWHAMQMLSIARMLTNHKLSPF